VRVLIANRAELNGLVIARPSERVIGLEEMESAHWSLFRQATAGLSDGVKIAFEPGDDEKQRRRRLERWKR